MKTTEKKYLTALQELKRRLDNNTSISLREFSREFSINNKVFTILVNEKLIQRHDRGIHTWNTIAPNIHMVRKIIQIQQEINRQSQINSKNKQQEIMNVDKSKKNRRYTTQETRYLLKNINTPTAELANNLNRSVSSIENFFHNRGLRKKHNTITIKENKKNNFSLFWGLIKVSWQL